MKLWTAWLVFATALTSPAQDDTPRGGLVLQFDDGYPSWTRIIAPVLKSYNGTATGFVNNQYIHSGRITPDELQELQNTYGWEIGSHGYRHENAPVYLKNHGAEHWIEHELLASLTELRGFGLQVRSFVFPFNASTPELERAVAAHVDSFRRTDPIALADGVREDGSVPGSAIDLAHYKPVRYLERWIDRAQRNGELLFLYGHQVLEDSAFITGRIERVGNGYIEADRPVELPQRKDLVFIPDTRRPVTEGESPGVIRAEGARIYVEGEAWQPTARAGNLFLIGPSYATPRSDFEALIRYSADRLRFLRLRDVAARPKSEPR